MVSSGVQYSFLVAVIIVPAVTVLQAALNVFYNNYLPIKGIEIQAFTFEIVRLQTFCFICSLEGLLLFLAKQHSWQCYKFYHSFTFNPCLCGELKLIPMNCLQSSVYKQ